MVRTLALPCCCHPSIREDCDGYSGRQEVTLEGQEWLIVWRMCRSLGGRPIKETMELLQEVSGHWICSKRDVDYLLSSRNLRWPRGLEPLITGGYGSAYYGLRDVARAVRGAARLACLCCGHRLNRRRPYRGRAGVKREPDVRHRVLFALGELSRGPGNQCSYPLRYSERAWEEALAQTCCYACEEELARRLTQEAETVLEQAEELKCLNAQIKALAKWLKTKDPEVFRSLPRGYGPAKSSRRRCRGS